MHGSEVDNMEVRLSTAEVRSPSLCFGFFLCVCVSVLGPLEAGYMIEHSINQLL